MALLFVVLCCLAQTVDDSADRISKIESHAYRESSQYQKGTRTIKARVETVKDTKYAIFEDVFEGVFFDKEYKYSTTETASLDRLRMMSCKLHIKTPVEDANISIQVKGAKAVFVAEKDGKKFPISRDITETTVSEAAMIRLLCAQNQKEGQCFKVDMLDIKKMEVQKDHAFTCKGKETIEIGGRKFDAFKWQENWAEKPTPGENTKSDSQRTRTYWINIDGLLLKRMGFDGVLELEVKGPPITTSGGK